MRPEERLAQLGMSLPTLDPPRGRYVRARRVGDVLYLAGHGPPPDDAGMRPTGRVGAEYDLRAGYDLARGAGLGLLATLREELHDLSAVSAVVHVFGMVNVANGFDATPAVIDGCSDLFLDVFGPEIGAHTRSAIGVAMLPYGMPVEIEAIVAVGEPA
jgi:enamine deaminase RidA (YjgF/YER057c/UK114 family)